MDFYLAHAYRRERDFLNRDTYRTYKVIIAMPANSHSVARPAAYYRTDNPRQVDELEGRFTVKRPVFLPSALEVGGGRIALPVPPPAQPVGKLGAAVGHLAARFGG
jgi:hypothetical protein